MIPHQPIPAFIQNLAGWEIALILFVLIFFVGGKRLPKLARGIGKSIIEFKKAKSNAATTFQEASKAMDESQV
ncbi:twin-arginine translocase TatA/TatE family subunit [Rubellicoccus peritrichatus]|uniref:Twin-arginine translocase TatA/TatE family subunit n=1 Tax=Rubellicoccus peritrichatus TaxID=3080537 RepID=A0AAQ3LDQ4_9BACT|nr:twin-arginine translocase TatA/TatE family subunit [Puniceicoccus sp. CR14]WOO40234.1 twin-arginine translocase TatA/TatE family subunit [Puniceicoccus sp. CR14]